MEDLATAPNVITETPAFDPNNPDHVARWNAAGRPDLEEVDNLGKKWGPTVPYDLQPDGSYLLRPAPQQAPVTDVERYKEVFVAARRNATLLVDSIKAAAQDALVKAGLYSVANATIQGVDFVWFHGDAISKFKEAGGHPAAALKLKAAFLSEESVNAFQWVPGLASVFESALTY